MDLKFKQLLDGSRVLMLKEDQGWGSSEEVPGFIGIKKNSYSLLSEGINGKPSYRRPWSLSQEGTENVSFLTEIDPIFYIMDNIVKYMERDEAHKIRREIFGGPDRPKYKDFLLEENRVIIFNKFKKMVLDKAHETMRNLFSNDDKYKEAMEFFNILRRMEYK